MLAEHNEEEHGIETDPKEIMDAVEGKMETHG
jgi:hypothetical protein